MGAGPTIFSTTPTHLVPPGTSVLVPNILPSLDRALWTVHSISDHRKICKGLKVK